MKLSTELIFLVAVAFLLSLMAVPALSRAAHRLGWVDRPNARKTHAKPVPLVGGIAVFAAVMGALLLQIGFWHVSGNHAHVLGIGAVLLLVGALDDRFDIRPHYRLLVQLACGYALAAAGIRIPSMYGVFGIYALDTTWQYLLTIIVVSGVVNAFNLMDGIDGLAGGLALLGLLVLGGLAIWLDQIGLAMVMAAFAGAALGFLRHNLGQDKVFLGDAGSLMLGFVLVATAIQLLQAMPTGFVVAHPAAIWALIGVFLLPVLDALRVFARRMRRGRSPMVADRSHLHHLLLGLQLNHWQAAAGVCVLSISLIGLCSLLAGHVSASLALLVAFVSYRVLSRLLLWHQDFADWNLRLQESERKK